MVESNAARDSPVLFRNFSDSFEDGHGDEDDLVADFGVSSVERSATL